MFCFTGWESEFCFSSAAFLALVFAVSAKIAFGITKPISAIGNTIADKNLYPCNFLYWFLLARTYSRSFTASSAPFMFLNLLILYCKPWMPASSLYNLIFISGENAFFLIK